MLLAVHFGFTGAFALLAVRPSSSPDLLQLKMALHQWIRWPLLLLSFSLSGLGIGAHGSPTADSSAGSASLDQECPVFFTGEKQCDLVVPEAFLPMDTASRAQEQTSRYPDLDILSEMLESANVLQSNFFSPWLGIWPESIDWTGAVLGTHISGALRSFSEALPLIHPGAHDESDWKRKANLIDLYFSQITAYYFGENALAIRNEAYDDILWVVLGWIEAIRFIDTHTELHFKDAAGSPKNESSSTSIIDGILTNQTYHGNLWVSAFAHRARVFWDLSRRGWDVELCGGGMIWNPRLLPYKNAITNELYIAGSIAMYLYFPGDVNESPFSSESRKRAAAGDPDLESYWEPRDPRYLKAAVEGYKWLIGSNMTNAQGLFIDGFHISGYRDKGNNNTKCDQRSNTVLTYNQGVLLTGQRGLWDATGSPSYLSDGHRLIQNVIGATGYDLSRDAPADDVAAMRPGSLPRWHGLGRLGVLEEPCDASGTCNQDATTFKGIFFHHLAAFCAPLAAAAPGSLPGSLRADGRALAAAAGSHARACTAYGGWLRHNAHAALATRDRDGKFGQWWTAGLLVANWTGPWPTLDTDDVWRDGGAADINTDPTFWKGPYVIGAGTMASRARGGDGGDGHAGVGDSGARSPLAHATQMVPEPEQKPMGGQEDDDRGDGKTQQTGPGRARDPNTRGRGRTVETHSGGLSLLRAYWKIAHAP
jgi:hypothetical protein